MKPRSERRVPWWAFVVLVLLVTVVPAFISVVVLGGGAAMEYPDVRSVVVDFVVPSAVVLVFIAALVTAFGLWVPVVHENRRVQGWMWLVPGALLATTVVVTDYRRLSDSPWVGLIGLFGVLLLVATEELVFRGVVLHEARQRTTEVRAAWISSVSFGLAHLLGGPIQILVSTVFGHLMYYTRRVSGGIILPIIVHAGWNYTLFTSLLTSTPSDEGTASVYLSLVSFALLITLVVRRRQIELKTSS